MIAVRVRNLLKERGKTVYWLSKVSGVSLQTLYRLSKGEAEAITFDVLEKVCRSLECRPGDVLDLADGESQKDCEQCESKSA